MDFRPRYQDDGLGPVHVADYGGSGPPLVCVHGLGGSHVNWVAMAAGLTDHWSVTAIDLPGFGLTPPVGRSGTIEANQRVLDAYLRSLGQPAFLVGNSMGGSIAVMQAAAAPDTVSRLLLISPAVAPFRGVRPDPLVASLFALYLIPGLATLALGGRRRIQSPEEIARWTLDLCTAQTARIHPDVIDMHTTVAKQRLAYEGVDRAFVQATRSLILDLGNRPRVRRRIASVSSPTMVIQGRQDRLIPLAAGMALISLRPDWRVEVLEDVGHLAMLEAPLLLNRMVAGWVEEEPAA